MNQVGQAAVWGTIGTLEAIAFGGSAKVIDPTKNYPQSTSIKDSVNRAELKNGVGDSKGFGFAGRKHEITVVIVPYDPTNPSVLATAKALPALPEPGAKVTLAGFSNTLWDGDWNYSGDGSVTSGGAEEAVKISLPCFRVGNTPAYLPAAS